jgi:phenylpyruvate tautomerase PptA (4-oxalocrotonate tautomerase family)
MLNAFSFFQEGDDAALAPFAPRLAKDLAPILSAASEDTLGLVLESLSVVVQVDKGSWVTPDLAISITQVILEVWHKNNKGETEVLEFLSFTKFYD